MFPVLLIIAVFAITILVQISVKIVRDYGRYGKVKYGVSRYC